MSRHAILFLITHSNTRVVPVHIAQWNTSGKFAYIVYRVYRVSIPLWHTTTQFNNNTNQIANQCKNNESILRTQQNGEIFKEFPCYLLYFFHLLFFLFCLCADLNPYEFMLCHSFAVACFPMCFFPLFSYTNKHKRRKIKQNKKLHRFRWLKQQKSIWEYYNNFAINLILNKIYMRIAFYFTIFTTIATFFDGRNRSSYI